MGIAVAPAILYLRSLKSGELTVLRHTLAPLQHGYWIVSRPEHRDDSSVAAFISWLEETGRSDHEAFREFGFQMPETKAP